MSLDLSVASEMAERINEQTEKSKRNRDGKGAVARRTQRREERGLSGAGLGEVLKDALPLEEGD